MKKVTTTILLICIFFINTYTQDFYRIIDENLDKKYTEIVKIIDKYYEGKDKGKGSGYKQYMRWQEYYSSKLNSEGKIVNTGKTNLDEYYLNYLTNTNIKSFTSTFGGNWKSLGPTSFQSYDNGYSAGLGRLNCFLVDPANSDIIYVGSPNGGLWRSNTNGNSWVPLLDGCNYIGVSGIAIDPSSPVNNRKIFILTGDGDGYNTWSSGVFVSSDNGATWQSTALGIDWEYGDLYDGFKLVIHPTNSKILFAAFNTGIYKTSDGGITWGTPKVVDAFVDIEFKPGTPATMYASTKTGKVYKSTNSGDSWTQITSDLPATSDERVAIAVSPANPSYLYVLYGNDGNTASGKYTGLYRSVNSGVSFSLRSDSPNILDWYSGSDQGGQSFYDLAIAVSPTNAEEVHIGGINCWKSNNGGTTWSRTSYWVIAIPSDGNYTHADIHNLEFYNNTLYCASDGGIFKSTNNGDDWQDISRGLEITQPYKIGIDENNPNKVLYGAQDNGLNVLENMLASQWYGADGFECFVQPGTSTIFGSIQEGIMLKSTNYGLTTSRISKPGFSNKYSPFINYLPTNAIYTCYEDLFVSTNDASTWSNISNGQIGPLVSRAIIQISPSNSNIIYVAKTGSIYKTVNHGTNWSNITSNYPGYPITGIVINPDDANMAWVVSGYFSWDGHHGQVYKTTNGGSSWIDISSGTTLPNIPISCIVYQNGSKNRIYIGNELGVFYIDDDHTDFVEFSNSLPNTEIRDLAIRYSDNKLIAGTHGRGIWETDLLLNCEDEVTYTGIHTYNINESAKVIVSSASLASNVTVKYAAVGTVKITKGFHANSILGSSFRAYADARACDDIYEYRSIQRVAKTGIYTGPMEGLEINDSSQVLSLNQIFSKNRIDIYPNPVENELNIKLNNELNECPVKITLYDCFGKEIDEIYYSKSIAEETLEIKYNTQKLNRGFYLLKIEIGQVKGVQRIVKLK